MHAWAEVCHLWLSSKSVLTGFLCSIGWRIIDQTRLSSNTPCTPTVFPIQQSCVILLLSDIIVLMRTREKNGVYKGSHSSSVSGWNCLVRLKSGKSDGLVHCSVENAAVLCENHRESVTQIWTSLSEEEERKNRSIVVNGPSVLRSPETIQLLLVQYFRDAV